MASSANHMGMSTRLPTRLLGGRGTRWKCGSSGEARRSDMDRQTERQAWHIVPLPSREVWNRIFQTSREGLTLSAPCPVCGVAALHRWYQVGQSEERVIDGQRFVARGGLTEWCSHCRVFVHYSALVPDWWQCDLPVDLTKFTGEPDALEEA